MLNFRTFSLLESELLHDMTEQIILDLRLKLFSSVFFLNLHEAADVPF
jgi:hypothetical protein